MCPACGKNGTLALQFLYGDVWLRKYRLGDRVVFEGGVTDVGEAGCKKVVLNALANMCEHCDIIGEPESYHYYVYVEDDIIKSVEPATGEFSFGDDEDDFLALEK